MTINSATFLFLFGASIGICLSVCLMALGELYSGQLLERYKSYRKPRLQAKLASLTAERQALVTMLKVNAFEGVPMEVINRHIRLLKKIAELRSFLGLPQEDGTKSVSPQHHIEPVLPLKVALS